MGSGSFVVNGTRLPDQITLNAGQGVEFEVHNFETDLSVEVEVSTADYSGSDPDNPNTSYKKTINGKLQATVPDSAVLDKVKEMQESGDSLSTSVISMSVDADGDVEATVAISTELGESVEVLIETGTILDNAGKAVAPAPGEDWDVLAKTAVMTEISTEPVITINSTDFEPPEANMVITDDASLLAAAIEQYGTPIRSINSVLPDSNGNLTIVPDEETVMSEADNTANFYACIAGINSAAGAIKITLSHAVPCESTAIVEQLMINIAELNSRASELQAMITRLDAANSNLAVKVAEMIQ
jgi:hypothetical protein